VYAVRTVRRDSRTNHSAPAGSLEHV